MKEFPLYYPIYKGHDSIFFPVSFLPIIRDIVGLATSIIAFTLSSSLALVTIAIGWFRYRPVLALSIIAAAAVPWYLSKRKAANEKSNESKKEEYHQ